MAKLLKLRRGNTSQHSSFTGAEGEVTVNTDNDSLVVHDGSTAGGHELLRKDLSNAPAGVIDNADVASNAAIAGTKISPDFGGQNITTTGTIRSTGNGGTISVGDNNDLFITHTNNGLIDNNTGDLTIQTQNAMQLKTADAEFGIQLVKHGGVQLYHDNNGPKFETTGSGVSVTGNITATGDATISGGDLTVTGGEGTSAVLKLVADEGDDNGDGWRIISNQDANDLTFSNDTSGSYADKMTLTNAGGLSITGEFSATGNITTNGDITASGGDLTVSGTTAVIHLTDTNNDDDFSVMNENGVFIIRDATNSANRLSVNSSGVVNIPGNTDFGAGIDVNGNITGTDLMTLTHNSDSKIKLVGNANSRIYFFEGSTDRGYLGWDASQDGYWLWNNQQGKGFLLNATPYWYDGSGYGTLWHSRNDGAGTGMDSDTVDGIHASSFLRADADDTASGLITASAGLRPGNLSVGQSAHSNTIQQVSGGDLHLQYNVSGNLLVCEGGGYMQAREIRPQTNNSYDLGTSSKRWRNIYTNDLNLSNEGSSNDVDGTWGDWTIQEGESDLFLKNNRSGKKYKFNLMEVS